MLTITLNNKRYRIVNWRPSSIEYEADPRHAEIIIKLCGDVKYSKILGSKSEIDREASPELG